jgi:MFS family permease
MFVEVGWAVALGWLGSAVAAAWLADELGRSPRRWLLIGLALGPVAVLTVGFAGRAPGFRFRRCVECLEAIPRLATTCPHCGSDLIEEVLTPHPPKGESDIKPPPLP